MTPWTIQSIEFSRPEYWSGYPFPSPGESSQPRSPVLQVDSLPAESPRKWTRNNTCFKTLPPHRIQKMEILKEKAWHLRPFPPGNWQRQNCNFSNFTELREQRLVLKPAWNEVLAEFQSGNHEPALRKMAGYSSVITQHPLNWMNVIKACYES